MLRTVYSSVLDNLHSTDKMGPDGEMPDGLMDHFVNELTSARSVIFTEDLVQEAKTRISSDIGSGSMRLPFEIPLPFDGVFIEGISDSGVWLPLLSGVAITNAKKERKDYQVVGIYISQMDADTYSFTLSGLRVQSEGENTFSEPINYVGGFSRAEFDSQNWENHAFRFAHLLLFYLFNDLSSRAQLGLEKRSDRVRIGKGANRRLHKIKDIVIITTKKGRREMETGRSRKVEWSHKWEVRGHWRQISPGSIGKNPTGKYDVLGWTWVRPSIKGPEKAPMVTKKRLIKQGPQIPTEPEINASETDRTDLH